MATKKAAAATKADPKPAKPAAETKTKGKSEPKAAATKADPKPAKPKK